MLFTVVCINNVTRTSRVLVRRTSSDHSCEGITQEDVARLHERQSNLLGHFYGNRPTAQSPFYQYRRVHPAITLQPRWSLCWTGDDPMEVGQASRSSSTAWKGRQWWKSVSLMISLQVYIMLSCYPMFMGISVLVITGYIRPRTWAKSMKFGAT